VAFPVGPPPTPSPPQHVIDGDLCEVFGRLSVERQRSIASALERTPGEVMKKLEDARNRVT
jgi:splicing factor 3B subunit 3